MRKKNPHITSRILAGKFNCGKTQVNTILAHQDNIREQYESNISNDSVVLGKRSRTCEFGEINELLCQKYLSFRSVHSCVRRQG